MQVQIDVATRQVVAYGLFGEIADPRFAIVDVADSEEPKLHQPGTKTLNADGTITVTPPGTDLLAQQLEQAALQRVNDAATLLNASAVRDTQQHRDAFARLIGVQPLTIPLTQDATAADIQPL